MESDLVVLLYEFGKVFRRFPVVKVLFDQTVPYLVGGRPYNLSHTAEMLLVMDTTLRDKQVKVTEDEALILFAATILHDAGDFYISNSSNAKSWNDKKRREEHMRLGAELSQQLLLHLTDFPPHLIDPVVGLVGTHDTIYLGKPPKTKLQKLLRSADAEFILTRHSFYKDLFSRIKKDHPETVTPDDAKAFLNQQADKYIRRDAYLYPASALALMNQNYEDRLEEIKQAEIEPGFLQLLCRRVQYVHKKISGFLSQQGTLLIAYYVSRSREILNGDVDFMLDALHPFD